MADWFRNLFHHRHKQQKPKPTTHFLFSQHSKQTGKDQTIEQPHQVISEQNNESNNNNNENNNQNRDSDQDSLGYTQVEWDQQTINFQLEDRMLDCLQDQKDVSSYRQTLSLSSIMVRRSSKRFSKKPLIQDNNNNISRETVSQIPIETILQQQYPEYSKQMFKQQSEHKNISQTTQQPPNTTYKTQQKPKQTTKRPKQNRFQKYKKKNQDVIIQTSEQSSWYNHFSPQLEMKIHTVVKQKAKEIQPQSNQTCDDYIQRVMKLKLTSNDGKKQQYKKNEESHEKEEQKPIIVKKQSTISQQSFQVVEEALSPNIGLQLLKNDINLTESTQSHTKNQITNQQNSLSKQQQQNQLLLLKKQIPQKEYISAQNQTLPLQASQKHQCSNKSPNFTQDQPHQKLYHKLTPPKNIFEQPPPSTKPSFIASNQVLPETNAQHTNKKPSSFTIETKPSPFPVKINFVSSLDTLPQFTPKSPILQAPKSPRAKILFNYGPAKPVQQNSQNLSLPIKNPLTSPTITQPTISPLSKPHETQLRTNIQIHYTEPQPQQRFPIFLRRLRRLNSCYPNLYSLSFNTQKINIDLKSILKAMQSAILVIELLYKKLHIQKHKLHEPFVKIQKIKVLGSAGQQQSLKEIQLLEKQIIDFFMHSGWQNYKIQEIEYIKPKQRFQKRKFQTKKFQQAMETYAKFIDFYLNEQLMNLKSIQQIKRYYRIRDKISTIVQYLRVISQDLYSFWLVECNYPEIYYDFLQFLNLDNSNDNRNQLLAKCDEIYAKLILAEEYKDPISMSVVGRVIMEKIQSIHNI